MNGSGEGLRALTAHADLACVTANLCNEREEVGQKGPKSRLVIPLANSTTQRTDCRTGPARTDPQGAKPILGEFASGIAFGDPVAACPERQCGLSAVGDDLATVGRG